MELAQWQGAVQQRIGAADSRVNGLLADVAAAERAMGSLLVRLDAAEVRVSELSVAAGVDRGRLRAAEVRLDGKVDKPKAEPKPVVVVST